MKKLSISETVDYDSLVPMFIENHLEFGMDEPVPTDLVKCWKAVDEDGKLQGGAVLAMREGKYICDGIAINSEFRKGKEGSHLLNHIIEEVKKRGGDSLFLVARAPKFFAANGFEIVSREDAPMFFECFSCPQYGKECFPEVMKFDI